MITKSKWSHTTVPEGYNSLLNLYDIQKAISIVKRIFADRLGGNLLLRRVSAPLFVGVSSGLNDDLSGKERAVSFDVPALGGDAAVVHSLAKWKRLALHKYDFYPGKGIYTDMNAIRRDEIMDNTHSIYVDQWDWEKVITTSDRNIDTLKSTVIGIVDAIVDTQQTLVAMFPQLSCVPKIRRKVKFITSQELEDMYPDLTPQQREDEICKEHKSVFIIGIGWPLKSGKPHDGRAPDYDDWNLNGDLLFWHDVLGISMELSSMGIRVDPKTMDKQLNAANCNDRRDFMFHKMLLNNELPLTIGGGIGQSRLCMLLLGCAHVGEVQVSLWDKDTLNICEQAGIKLL